MHKLILGSIEVLHELVQLIQRLDDKNYQAIGSHVCHTLDIYQSLISSEHHRIDYDVKRHGSEIETKRFVALKELVEIENWLMALDDKEFEVVKVVKTEVCLSVQHSENLTSTLGRELCFAASHASHHLALILVMAKSMNMMIDGQLGIAPETASF